MASAEGFISPADGRISMRALVASAALGAAFVLMPAAAGYTPAWSQDFSITNPEVPADGSRRDLMRQLQAWWDVHGYYPRYASRNDEGGTVNVYLDILRDGRIGSVRVVGNSGSQSLDAAALKAFTGGFVRPLPEAVPQTGLDISLHYVLARRHDQPVPADYKPVPSKTPFTISNDPVTSPILEKMLQKTCAGTIVINAIRNHPWYGIRYYGSTLVFFRKPDGTPWVKFSEGGRLAFSQVVEVGKLVSWTGPASSMVVDAQKLQVSMHYTAWLDGDNKLNGCFSRDDSWHTNSGCESTIGILEFSCAEEVVPQIEWSSWYAIPAGPSGDPP
jgi:TonB family protein